MNTHAAQRDAIFRKRNSKFCSPAKHGRHASMNTKLAVCASIGAVSQIFNTTFPYPHPLERKNWKNEFSSINSRPCGLCGKSNFPCTSILFQPSISPFFVENHICFLWIKIGKPNEQNRLLKENLKKVKCLLENEKKKCQLWIILSPYVVEK
jgi:hypothetical protein